MKRQQLLHLLEQYQATEDEIGFKRDIISFIAHHPDCFERTLSCGHITASCWLVNSAQSHALLTHHAKLDRWFQLGGHCDGMSDPLAVALKEAQEESGIMAIVPLMTDIFDIDIHLIPENSKERAHYHYDIRFLLRVVGNESITVSNESKALRWIGKEETLPTDNPSVVRMFRKWVAFE